jgi:hypothetical protein
MHLLPPLLILLIIVIIILIYITNPTIKLFEGLPDSLTTYDISNIEQVYHPTYIDTNIDASGGFALPVFYKPNSYKYSSKPYVPNYVDSIYMSSLTGLSNVAQYYDVSDNSTSHDNNF